MTIDDELTKIAAANKKATAASTRDWCPPSVAAKLVAEAQILRAALDLGTAECLKRSARPCNEIAGLSPQNRCHTCRARDALRPDRKLGEP